MGLAACRLKEGWDVGFISREDPVCPGRGKLFSLANLSDNFGHFAWLFLLMTIVWYHAWEGGGPLKRSV